MLERLKRWWLVNRHIRALSRTGMHVVLSRLQYEAHTANVMEFQRWVNESGSLQDGTVPNHTKKMVEAYCRTIRFHCPLPITVVSDGA